MNPRIRLTSAKVGVEVEAELGKKQNNKTKVKSVQLGKTLSFVKFVIEWGGVEGGKTLDCSLKTLESPTYQILASCYAYNPTKSFRWWWWWVILESEFSVHLWSEASA